MAQMKVKNKQTGVVSVEEVDIKNKCAAISIPSLYEGAGGIQAPTTLGISWEKFCNEYEILGPEEEDEKINQ